MSQNWPLNSRVTIGNTNLTIDSTRFNIFIGFYINYNVKSHFALYQRVAPEVKLTTVGGGIESLESVDLAVKQEESGESKAGIMARLMKAFGGRGKTTTVTTKAAPTPHVVTPLNQHAKNRAVDAIERHLSQLPAEIRGPATPIHVSMTPLLNQAKNRQADANNENSRSKETSTKLPMIGLPARKDGKDNPTPPKTKDILKPDSKPHSSFGKGSEADQSSREEEKKQKKIEDKEEEERQQEIRRKIEEAETIKEIEERLKKSLEERDKGKKKEEESKEMQSEEKQSEVESKEKTTTTTEKASPKFKSTEKKKDEVVSKELSIFKEKEESQAKSEEKNHSTEEKEKKESREESGSGSHEEEDASRSGSGEKEKESKEESGGIGGFFRNLFGGGDKNEKRDHTEEGSGAAKKTKGKDTSETHSKVQGNSVKEEAADYSDMGQAYRITDKKYAPLFNFDEKLAELEVKPELPTRRMDDGSWKTKDLRESLLWAVKEKLSRDWKAQHSSNPLLSPEPHDLDDGEWKKDYSDGQVGQAGTYRWRPASSWARELPAWRASWSPDQGSWWSDKSTDPSSWQEHRWNRGNGWAGTNWWSNYERKWRDETPPHTWVMENMPGAYQTVILV
jgi:hypothetical protein